MINISTIFCILFSYSVAVLLLRSKQKHLQSIAHTSKFTVFLFSPKNMDESHSAVCKRIRQ